MGRSGRHCPGQAGRGHPAGRLVRSRRGGGGEGDGGNRDKEIGGKRSRVAAERTRPVFGGQASTQSGPVCHHRDRLSVGAVAG